MGHTIATITHFESATDGRKKRTTRFLVAGILLATGLILSISRSGKAQDAVLDWNANAANAIIGIAKVPAPRALIRFAMVHTAIYDAVNAIQGYPFEAYAVNPQVISPASPEAGAAAAAHDVLVALFPDQRADLDAKYAASLAAIPDGPAKTNGISVGQQAAAGILSFRANDGRNAVVPYTPGSGPGVWIPTPPGFLPAQTPEAAYVQPFTLNSPSQFRAEPPPDLSSETWIRDYNETKSLGRATNSTRTPEQTDLGRFISDLAILQWNRAWRRISGAQGLPLADNARFFAMLTTASADSLIACYDSKYFYNRWRPVTAIRAGDTDGNPETEPDPDWISLVITPNHPEYPAAHGCFSGASTETLEYFFGTDKFDFTLDSTVAGLTNPVRYYTSFSQALQDILDARVYGGMHFRNSTQKGALIGKQVSHFATTHFFRRSRAHGAR
jgi:PAP2 superfamily protein